MPQSFHLMTSWPFLQVQGPSVGKDGEVTVPFALNVEKSSGPFQTPTTFAQLEPLDPPCFATAGPLGLRAGAETSGCAASLPDADLPCLPMVPPVLPDCACAGATQASRPAPTAATANIAQRIRISGRIATIGGTTRLTGSSAIDLLAPFANSE